MIRTWRPEALPDLLVLEPEVHTDERGRFLETYRRDGYLEAGIEATFVQDNLSRSRRGVLRGLHFQHPRPQGKLMTVVRGRVFDVAVDIRRGSPTFGRWFGLELSDDTHRQLWIPPDFAHGFCVLSERADVAYRCTEYYRPEAGHVLRWDDPEVGVEWPLGDDGPVLSERDRAGLALGELAERGELPTYGG